MNEIILSFGDTEYKRALQDLENLYGPKGTPSQKAKKALKTFLQNARQATKTKTQGNKAPIPPFLKKLYLTSRGNFIPVHKMDENHIFNSVRKMERTFRSMRDHDHTPYPSADDAFPSLPGFAGYADLVSALQWHHQSPKK